MLQASAVTADKIKVDSLSSITANVGTLTGGTITGSTIVGTTIQNASGTFSVSSEGVIKGATIDAQSFRKSGFEISAVKQEVYTLADGASVPCPEGYKREDCIYIVLSIKNLKSIGSYRYSYNKTKEMKEFDKFFPNIEDMKFVGVSSMHLDSVGNLGKEEMDQRVGVSKDYILIAKRRSIVSHSGKNGSYNTIHYYTGYADVICIAFKK